MNDLTTSPSSLECYICFEEFVKSFGQYVYTVKLHSTTNEAHSHRIHYDCLIDLFKSSLENNLELSCPMCKEPLDMDFVARIAVYTLQRCRATESTPGATKRDCPLLLPGFIADIDMEFALKIIEEVEESNEPAKKRLIKEIVTYWEAPHPAFETQEIVSKVKEKILSLEPNEPMAANLPVEKANTDISADVIPGIKQPVVQLHAKTKQRRRRWKVLLGTILGIIPLVSLKIAQDRQFLSR